MTAAPAGATAAPRPETRPALRRAHWIVLGVLWALSTVLIWLAVDAGLDEGPRHAARTLLSAAATPAGPLVGAIARNFQGCCLRFSLTLLWVCLPALAVGVAAPLAGAAGDAARGAWVPRVRMALWTLGWLTWFAGGLVSLAHALE